eukprot:4498602-Pleurochrysis_carterae.AAC.1
MHEARCMLPPLHVAPTVEALIEFNIFCPAGLQLAGTVGRLEAFEAFWEAEAPRVGHAQVMTFELWQLQ